MADEATRSGPVPDPQMDNEQAEGARRTVAQALDQQGITNKPLAEEQEQQSKLPPRGEAKTE